ncbi:hypothetical protein AMAG_06599 [Allomyces macrogynus ATCC 38327]|uniref:Structural maintenance of chromosomes protein n=1 Tax=Allomyces macrogynus (strain ATCC 38327) TaxID=578462 RepID=A0A0L0SE62_ALLM3|nr:hypothetical protein AMAG_06599 [Allomyces macrogynus ATCC 38327]|eukprot:KNE60833.1 hypothetical protein AMAG_06599 [Allomyces macrogynus ATCC 38327]
MTTTEAAPPMNEPVGDAAAPPAPTNPTALTTNATTLPPPPGPAPLGGPRLVMTRMVLTNFKSYAGKQEIGPFHKSFTAVVGPNGSGKSNVIDALLFVFGYRASKMRQNKLGNLVHYSEKYPNLDQCTVEIHFQELQETNGVESVVPGSDLLVSRTAFKNNQSRYSINQRPASYVQVTALLKSKGVDLTHQRFLILQGEVESIAQMKPKGTSDSDEGLLEYLEDIIGTAQYKDPIEAAQRDLDALDDLRHEKLARVKLVEQELARLQDAKDAAEAYLAREAEMRRMQAKLYRHMADKHARATGLARTTLTNAQARLGELDEACGGETARHEQADLERRAKEAAAALAKARTDLQKHDADLKRLTADDIKVRELKKSAKRKADKARKARDKAQMVLAEKTQWMENYETDQQMIQDEIDEVNNKLQVAQTKVDDLKVQLRFKTQDMQKEMDARQAELRPWTHQVSELTGRLGVIRAEQRTLTESLQRAAKARDQLTARREELEARRTELVASTATLQAERTQTSTAHQAARARLAEVAAAQQMARTTAQQARTRAEEALASTRATRNRGDVLGTLRAQRSQRWPGLADRLGNLGTIDARYDVAVSTAAGGSLDMIVVDKVSTAQACLEFLRTNRLGRASFVCLDKLPNYDTRPIKTPENAPRLFDLVTCRDSKYAPAMYHAMRDTLVAEDLDHANRIAYTACSGRQRWRVVTLGGQLIEASGAMSGGGNYVSRGRMKLADGRNAQQSGDEDEVDEATVARLEQERDAAAHALAQVSHEHDALTQQVSELHRAAAAAERAAMKGNVELEQVERDLNQVVAELATADQAAVGSGKRGGKARKSQADETGEAKIKALDKEAAKIETELAKVQAKAQELEAAVANLQAKIDDVGGIEYKVARTQAQDYARTAEQLARKAATAQVQYKQAEKQAAAAQATMAQCDEDMAAAEQEMTALAQQLDDVTAKALDVTNWLEAAQSGVDDATELHDELTKDLRAREEVFAKHARERAELVATIEDLQAKIQTGEHHVKQWRAKLADVQAAIKAATAAAEARKPKTRPNQLPHSPPGLPRPLRPTPRMLSWTRPHQHRPTARQRRVVSQWRWMRTTASLSRTSMRFTNRSSAYRPSSPKRPSISQSWTSTAPAPRTTRRVRAIWPRSRRTATRTNARPRSSRKRGCCSFWPGTPTFPRGSKKCTR